jgi:hypothetical protein
MASRALALALALLCSELLEEASAGFLVRPAGV